MPSRLLLRRLLRLALALLLIDCAGVVYLVCQYPYAPLDRLAEAANCLLFYVPALATTALGLAYLTLTTGSAWHVACNFALGLLLWLAVPWLLLMGWLMWLLDDGPSGGWGAGLLVLAPTGYMLVVIPGSFWLQRRREAVSTDA